MDNQAAGAGAPLTGSPYRAKEDRSHGEIKISIFSDDDPIVSTQFENSLTQPPGDHLRYMATHFNRPGETDQRQTRVVNYRLGNIAVPSNDQIKDPIDSMIRHHPVADMLDGD
jgi:hypothetical protein